MCSFEFKFVDVYTWVVLAVIVGMAMLSSFANQVS